MTLADIPSGELVFVDANIFLFYFLSEPVLGPPCDQFLRRIENGDIEGFTPTHILNELVHRLMTEEAQHRFGLSATGIARQLRRHPALVRQLSRPRQAIDELSLIGLYTLPVFDTQVSLAVDVSNQLGLLASDALVVTVMRQHGLRLLASHDPDFDCVPGLNRYAPI